MTQSFNEFWEKVADKGSAAEAAKAIPEDILQAAREAAAKVWESLGSELAAEFRRGMRDDSGSVESAVSAILAERERSQWQPIGTAPKDETQVLLYGVCRKPSVDAGRTAIVIGYWTDFNTGGWVWYGAAMEFTHWQPLPAAPKAEA